MRLARTFVSLVAPCSPSPSQLNDGQKSCTREQFKHIFNFDEESLDILYDAFDIDHSGTLELAEMISGLSFMCRGR